KRIEQDPNVKRQKDLDARWTRKNNERYYGYKDHVCIDNKHKLIREYEVISTEVHDSQVLLNYWVTIAQKMFGRTAPIMVRNVRSRWM
ncbi:transposase, partial [Microbulbifer epialgicus]